MGAVVKVLLKVASSQCSHSRAWDKATRDGGKWIDPLHVEDTRKRHNVAVWSNTFGYQSATIESIDAIRERILAFDVNYQGYFTGQRVVENPDEGPLRDFYNDLQAALQKAKCLPGERKLLEARVEATIGLLVYDRAIRSKFATVEITSKTGSPTGLCGFKNAGTCVQRRGTYGRCPKRSVSV